MNKLIKISDTHYIIVDDSEIKDTSYFIDNNKIFECRNVFNEGIEDSNGLIHNPKNCKKITHSTEPLIITRYFTDKLLENYNGLKERIISIQTLSLTEVEEVINGYSVEKLVKEITSFDSLEEYENNFKLVNIGFKAHQELVKDKLHKILSDFYVFATNGEVCKHEVINEFLLPKTEWDIEFTSESKIKLL